MECLPFPLAFSLFTNILLHWWHFLQMLPSPGSLPSTLLARANGTLLCTPAAHLLYLHHRALSLVQLFSSHGYFRLSLIRQGLCLVHYQSQVCDKFHSVSAELESLTPIWYSFNQNICKLISLHISRPGTAEVQAGSRIHHLNPSC